MQKQWNIRFSRPAEDSISGWKNASMPLGNGYMGISVFGGVARERIQLTEPTLVTGGTGYIANRYCAGQESFGDLILTFPQLREQQITDYERTLNLNTGVASVVFRQGNVRYERTYLASYPDGVGVVHLSASERASITLTLACEVAYLREHLPVDPPPMGTAKRADVRTEGDTLIATGYSEWFGIHFEGQFLLLHKGGTLSSDGTHLTVCGADEVTVLFLLGTNYVLEEKTFLLGREEKLRDNAHPHEELTRRLRRAAAYTYGELYARHVADHGALFARCTLDLGGADDGRESARLIASHREGNRERYLEELYFAMGRYMLIATSRPGTLPAGLQGKWNAYEIAPWTAGYWYNVNQQMNYWPVFSTNLKELYEPYRNFNAVRMTQAQKNGDDYIRSIFPDRYEEGEGKNGWIVGTGNSAYHVSGASKSSHSGPGTGGFTAICDIDYYRFTRSDEALRTVYPILESLGRFYSKCVVGVGEEYLVKYSASPEQKHEGKIYVTTGCAFDQQMVYESVKALVDMYDAADGKIEGADHALIAKLRAQLPHYSPVLIGESGQVKEYREESFYGEIGEKHHRHISQLVGLYPGTVINESTAEWLEAAKKTLRFRGLDTGTAWSIAHKLGMWARVGDGEISYLLLCSLIHSHLYDNLWSCHDTLTPERFDNSVFQADANFGATAAIAEMLLSSSGKNIRPLFALPRAWHTGKVTGLMARGGFCFDMCWEAGKLSHMTVTSEAGAELRISYGGLARAAIEKNGIPLDSLTEGDTVIFPTEVGDVFTFRF